MSSSPTSTCVAVPLGRRRFTATLVSVAAASAVLPFSITGTAVALPELVDGVSASVSEGQWVQNAFNLTFASLALVWGSLADRFGRRRVLRSGTAVVALASLAVALSHNGFTVDVIRLIQGAGASAVLASGAAVLADATAEGSRRRTIAFGALGTSFGAGLALGPLVAGALVALAGWQAPFYAVALTAAAAWCLAATVTESRAGIRARPDVPGALSFTAGLACVSYCFVAASTDGWSAMATLCSAGAAVVLITGFALIEARNPERAMFDVRLFTRPAFVAVICQPFALTLVLVVLLAYLPPYLQGIGGRTILESGLALLPLTVPVLVLPAVGAWLVSRVRLRVVLTGSAALVAAGTGLLTLTPATSISALVAPLLISGTGVGLAFGVLDNAAISTVPVDQAGAASGIFNTMRLAGESIAVAGAAALLTAITAAGLPTTPDRATVAGRAVQGILTPTLRPLIAPALNNALHTTALVLTAISLVGAILTYIALPAHQRHDTARHQPTTS